MVDEELRRTVCNNIRARMDELQITQRVAARATGISLPSLNRYITGRTLPSLDAAVKIARGLNMSLDDLVK